MILEQKIEKLEKDNNILKVQYDYLKSMNTIIEDKITFLQKVINNTKNDINDDITKINTTITENINNIKNNNIITENLLQAYEIKFKNISNENNNNINMNVKNLENRFDDFTNNIYNEIGRAHV